MPKRLSPGRLQTLRGPGARGLPPMANGLEVICGIPIMLAAAHLEMMVGKCAEPSFDCRLTGLVMRYGAPLVFGKVVAPIEVDHAIAKAAGKEPRDRG